MSSRKPLHTQIIDTHCHLNHADLLTDVDSIVDRAQEAGVEKMIVVGFDLPSSDIAVQLAGQHPSLFAAVAVHPHDARNYDRETELKLRDLAANPCVVAIGEIGLDFHYDFSPADAQYAAFQAQIALASDCGLPLIIHCREAYDEVLQVLEDRSANEIGGVMHCWGGNSEQVRRTLELGFYLGFGGVITFKNAEETRRIASELPLNRLLLETDAPYLAPVPYRGKQNEPAYVALVAKKLAEVRGISVEEVAAETSVNAERLFSRTALDLRQKLL